MLSPPISKPTLLGFVNVVMHVENMHTSTSTVDEATGDVYFVASACIAFAFFDPDDERWFHSYLDVDRPILKHMVQGKQTYIGQLEGLAFAAFLESVRCSAEPRVGTIAYFRCRFPRGHILIEHV